MVSWFFINIKMKNQKGTDQKPERKARKIRERIGMVQKRIAYRTRFS